MKLSQVSEMCQMFVNLANCVEFKHFGNEPYTHTVHTRNKLCYVIRDGKPKFIFRVEDTAVHLMDGDNDYIQFDSIEELTHFLFAWTSVIPVVYGFRF